MSGWTLATQAADPSFGLAGSGTAAREEEDGNRLYSSEPREDKRESEDDEDDDEDDEEDEEDEDDEAGMGRFTGSCLCWQNPERR